MFQMSGQGPYFGQAGWFSVLHPEKIPSAIERYSNEARRILSVIEEGLKRNGNTGWLVGNKCTFADLAFVTWNDRLDAVLGLKPEENPVWEFERVKRWHASMVGRDSFKKSMKKREEMMDQLGLMPNGMPKGVNNIEEYEEHMKKAKEGH